MFQACVKDREVPFTEMGVTAGEKSCRGNDQRITSAYA